MLLLMLSKPTQAGTILNRPGEMLHSLPVKRDDVGIGGVGDIPRAQQSIALALAVRATPGGTYLSPSCVRSRRGTRDWGCDCDCRTQWALQPPSKLLIININILIIIRV